MISALRLFALISLVTCLALPGLRHPADAQQPASPRRVGVLLAAFSPEGKEAQAFRQGLRDAGYVDERDVVIDWRSAGGDYARLPALAVELVKRKADVILADTTLATKAIKRATS